MLNARALNALYNFFSKNRLQTHFRFTSRQREAEEYSLVIDGSFCRQHVRNLIDDGCMHKLSLQDLEIMVIAVGRDIPTSEGLDRWVH